MKLLHVADVHINENINFTRTIDCMRAAADLAIEHSVDLTVIAGNLMDRPRPSPIEYAEGFNFVFQLTRQAPVIIIPGDIGHELGATGVTCLKPFQWIPRVCVPVKPLGMNWPMAQIFVLPTLPRHVIGSQIDLTAEDTNSLLMQYTAEIIETFKSRFIDGSLPKILVAHVNILGSAYSKQATVGLMDLYLDPSLLDGFDYVALGHLHRGHPVASNAYYSGCLNRQSFAEEDIEPHALIVDVESGRPPKVTPIAMPATEYRSLTVEEIMNGKLQFNPECRYRVIGRIKATDLPALKAVLLKLPVKVEPAFEIISEASQRSERLTRDLGLEVGIREYIALHPEYQDKENELISIAMEIEREYENQ
jgi:exonuclease SbcD